MLGDVGQLVLDVIGALGYLGLALLLVAENLFPPIPSEVVLPLAGFLVERQPTDEGSWSKVMGEGAAERLEAARGSWLLSSRSTKSG